MNVGPIIEAVAENFNDVVYNNGKDTMVLFYAFWCRRCKLFSQVYDELGLKVSNLTIFTFLNICSINIM